MEGFMRKRQFSRLGFQLLFLLSILVLTAAQLSAQSLSTASIIGQVKDETGAVIPGVSVSASSPALQLQHVSALTDERGEYRLVELPLGVYEVTYTLPGFQGMQRNDLRLTAGFVAKIDVVLKPGGVSETLTVVTESPIVYISSCMTVPNCLMVFV